MSGLRVSSLQAGYVPGRPVVTGTFDVQLGRIAAIVGPNGAGKSTLLKTMLGLRLPIAGEMTMAGVPLPEHRNRHGIGYLPEHVALPKYWTTASALVLAASACRRGTAIDREFALRIGGVDFAEQISVAEMSKGMRQRLAIALAFVPVPQLAFLDEPESGLDPAQRVRFRESLRRFADDGRVVVVASHDVSGICSVADVTLLCASGRITPVARGQLTNSDELVRLFAEGA